MKKVCLVTSLHNVKDERVYEKESVSLAKKYDVYLVAPNTDTRDENGVHIIGVDFPGVNHRLKRWITLGKLIPILAKIDADVYHFQDPELIRIGLKMKKYGKKVIFDSHEDVPAYLLSASFIPNIFRGFVSKCYTLYEKSVLRRYDALVSVTPFIVKRLNRINPNTYQITNYPRYNDCTLERKWERKVIFAGLIGRSWNLDKVISVLPSTETTLILCGRFYDGGKYLDYLKTIPGWDKVDYRGCVSHSMVREFYSECSAGLAIESYDDANIGFREGSLGNTKRLEYMSMGIPLITSASNVWKSVVDKNNCGVCVEDPKNEGQIAEAISLVVDNKEEAIKMGDNAKKAVATEYNWNTQEAILFEMYENLLGA